MFKQRFMWSYGVHSAEKIPSVVSNFEHVSRLTNCMYSRGFLHFFLDTVPIVDYT
jgi:hypothetical protein